MYNGTPEQVVLGYRRKQAEQALESRPAPARTYLSDRVWPEGYEMKCAFSPDGFLLWCFITAIETPTETLCK